MIIPLSSRVGTVCWGLILSQTEISEFIENYKNANFSNADDLRLRIRPLIVHPLVYWFL